MTIRNVHLLVRLQRARAPRTQPPCPDQSPPPVRLLGRGLDALICKTRWPEPNLLDRLLNPRGVRNRLEPPSDNERLRRYRDAVLQFVECDLFEWSAREIAGHAARQRVRTHRASGASADDNVIPFQPLRARSR